MLIKREGPLVIPHNFPETKDPCPVFDGKQWHLYGSGGDTLVEEWHIFHATAPTIHGPWAEEDPAKIALDGPRVAAPGVIYDTQEQLFHMFIQTDFMRPNGTIEHLLSSDGHRFNNFGTVFRSLPDTEEAGIYDPHPAIVHGKKYLVYSGMKDSRQLSDSTPHSIAYPEIFLAVSMTESWYGPWERVGKILSHNDVPHHNQPNSDTYEWGLEGAQLVELPNGRVLLNAVCFLPEGSWMTRQRVFFAIADRITGPYKTLGPVLDPAMNAWESGENGHATALLHEDRLHLFYQARAVNGPWRYGRAEFDPRLISSI